MFKTILTGVFGMFCSYLSQFLTVLAKNWTVGKVAGIRTLTRTRTRRYPYPKPAGVAKPLEFPKEDVARFNPFFQLRYFWLSTEGFYRSCKIGGRACSCRLQISLLGTFIDFYQLF